MAGLRCEWLARHDGHGRLLHVAGSRDSSSLEAEISRSKSRRTVAVHCCVLLLEKAEVSYVADNTRVSDANAREGLGKLHPAASKQAVAAYTPGLSRFSSIRMCSIA